MTAGRMPRRTTSLLGLLCAALFVLLLPLEVARGGEPASARFTLRARGQSWPVEAYLEPHTRLGTLTVGAGHARYVSPVRALWKVLVHDLDGDGEDEIVLGVWSEKPRQGAARSHRTLWIMRWDGARIVPSWRGSALARPLRDAALAQLDDTPGAELLALERVPASCFLTVYRWSGFGFYGLARRGISCGAKLAQPDGCLLDGGRLRCARLVEGKLVLP